MESATQEILQTLLRNEPALAKAIAGSSIRFTRSKSGDYFSKLIITCADRNTFFFLASNKTRLWQALYIAIPMEIDIELANESIKSIHQATRPEKNMVATLTNEETTVIRASINTVSLQSLPAILKEQIISEVAQLQLPVLLRQDGGFDLPETSFDEAWKNIGNRMKLGVDSLPQEATEKPPKSTKQSSVPRLMNKSFGADDVHRAKNGTRRTLQAFLAKVNMKGKTETEVLEAIASGTDYGKQLTQKLYEGYSKKIPGLNDAKWSEILTGIIAEVQKMISGDPDESAEDSD